MRAPVLYSLRYLRSDHAVSVTRSTTRGWCIARPDGLNSLYERLRCTWLVFTGKADAVRWPEDDA